jgi:hypothetical protein
MRPQGKVRETLDTFWLANHRHFEKYGAGAMAEELPHEGRSSMRVSPCACWRLAKKVIVCEVRVFLFRNMAPPPSGNSPGGFPSAS